LAYPIEKKVKKEYRASKSKHPQKINRISAYATLQKISDGMLLGHTVQRSIETFNFIVYKTGELIRPGRQNPRKKRPKNIHYMNNKRL
jgi:hypothetical protein